MNLKADVDRKFILRFLILGVAGFGLMIWGLYDAIFSYPRELTRSQAYYQIQQKVEAGELNDAESSKQWESLCQEKGWAIVKPKEPHYAQQDIYFQWGIAAVGLIAGAGFLVKYLMLIGSWVQADENGVTTSWGKELKFAAISQINKRKWEKKGIAKVTYQDDAGNDQVMVFDDFKYHRETMGQILRLAEKGLEDSQIIGGRRETDPVADSAETDDSATDEATGNPTH